MRKAKFSHKLKGSSVKASLCNSDLFPLALFSEVASTVFLHILSEISYVCYIFPLFIDCHIPIHTFLKSYLLYLTVYFEINSLSVYTKLPHDFLH